MEMVFLCIMQPLYRSLPNEKRNGDTPEVTDHAPVKSEINVMDNMALSAPVTEESNLKRKRNRKNNVQEKDPKQTETVTANCGKKRSKPAEKDASLSTSSSTGVESKRRKNR